MFTGDPPHWQKQTLAQGERLEEDIPSQWPPKTSRSSNTYHGQRDFKLTLIKRDKEGHSILIRGEIHQKEITIINLYASNISVPNFIEHTLKDLEAYIYTPNTVVVGNFNTPLSPIDRSTKQKINKEILELNHTIDQMDLADV
jgi:hypothetical protein